MRGWTSFVMVAMLWCHVQHATAQVTWRRSFGGYGSDVAKSVRTTAEGNYIVCGSTGSFGAGGGDIYLALLDPNGELIWSRTYGGPGVEQGNCVRQTTDGGFIIAGLTNSFGAGGYDGYVVKTDVAGVEEWSRVVGGVDWDQFKDLELTAQGYVLAGSSYSANSTMEDGWLVHIDLVGEVDWETRTDFEGPDSVEDIDLVSGGGFVGGGWSRLNGESALWFGFDSNGALQDTTQLAVDSATFSGCVALQSGSVLVGSRTLLGKQAILTTRFDSSGQLQWTDVLSHPDGCWAEAVAQRASGQLAIIGNTRTYGSGGSDFFLLLENESGWYEFATTFGASDDDFGHDVAITDDGAMIVCGSLPASGNGPSEVFVVKTDTNALTTSTSVVHEFDALSTPDEEWSEGSYVIYPDPADVGALIQIRGPRMYGSKDLLVTDASGKQVDVVFRRTNPDCMSFTVSSSGVFLVRFGSAVVGRLIVF